MNNQGFVAWLVEQTSFHPALRVLLESPLVLQGMAVAGVLLLMLVWPRSMGRSVTRGEIVYQLKGCEIRINPKAHAPVIGVRKGWNRYSALSAGLDRGKSDKTVVQAVTETTTGTTSGGMTSDGKYILPQTVILTRNTGQFYERKVACQIRLSFWAISGDGVERIRLDFNLPSRKEKDFDRLWAQLTRDLGALEERFLPAVQERVR